jgi:hypothetical protein
MNKIGIELYKQSAEFAYTTIGKEHADTTYFQATVAGKFAELIVEECATIALKSGDINNKSMQAKVEAERIYHKIKEHFGVD